MTKEQKLKISPYQSQGRWYQIFMENDAGTYKITTIDSGIRASTIDDNVITLPENFILIDAVCECHATAETSGSMTQGHAGITPIITLPENVNFAYVYAYGYFA